MREFVHPKFKLIQWTFLKPSLLETKLEIPGNLIEGVLVTLIICVIFKRSLFFKFLQTLKANFSEVSFLSEINLLLIPVNLYIEFFFSLSFFSITELYSIFFPNL